MSSLSSSPRGSPRHDPRRRSRRPTARSSTLFGAIKSLVAKPIAWLGGGGDFEDTPGKRRRTPASQTTEGGQDEHQAKKTRYRGPTPPPPFEPVSQQAQYLDIPQNVVATPPASRSRPGHGRSSSLAAPPAQRRAGSHGRHSPTAAASLKQPMGVARTQSMDPPGIQTASSRGVVQARGKSGDVSMESASVRDATITRSFSLRTSVTPQPDGQVFGPAPFSRDPSNPPPLTSLISRPVFVKPPSQPRQYHPLTPQSTVTLGTLAEVQRRDGSPMRQHSTLLISQSGSTMDTSGVSASSLRPMSAAEKALKDLDVYKTPLLPSRLRGSKIFPNMFEQKRMPAPILMTKRKDNKPRLGMSEKRKKRVGEQELLSVKPYAGQGGMKRLLARRRMEEEEEREKEREAAIHTDQDEDGDGGAMGKKEVEPQVSHQADAKRPEASASAPRVPASDFASIPAGGRASSLRVGRNTTNRNHISHPFARPKNRFSARYEEDDAEDSMSTSDTSMAEISKPALPTLFQMPAGFSFAKDNAPLKHDTADAKEPPIAALPFSFSKPNTPSISVASTPSPKPTDEPVKAPISVLAQLSQATSPAPPLAATTVKESVASVAPPTPELSVAPSISFTPATPTPAAPAPSSSVPNFFANSSIFSKPGVTIAPPASSSAPPAASVLTGENKPQSGDSAPISVPAIQLPKTPLFGGSSSSTEAKATFATDTNKASSASLFGNTPSSNGASIFGGSNNAAAPSPLFGATVKASTPLLAPSLFVDTSAKSPAPAAAPTFSFAAPVKPADQSETSAKLFTFGAAAKPAENSAPATSPSFSFGATAKSTEPPASSPSFVFGASAKAAETKEPEQKPTLQPSLFPSSSASAPTFGGFGTAPSTTGTASSDQGTFVFGRPSSSPATSTPAVEAPKPLFGGTTSSSSGFSFARPSSSSAVEAPAAKSPFTFGATPPPTSVDKPAVFTFGTPASSTSTGSTSIPFGAPTSGSNGADVSKPFAFGAPAATPARPLTPPRNGNDQEVQMDESPVRGGAMDVYANGKQEVQKSSNGFAFSTPGATVGTSPFGQPSQSTSSSFSFGAPTSSSGAFGVKPAEKPEAKPVPAFGGFGSSSSTGFGGFGQPKAPESIQSPLSPSPFASGPFGQPSTTAPGGSSGFPFGAPPTGGGPFGQAPVNGSSNPASPSTFGAPGAFSFGTPTSATAPSNPFGFGSSQPASPAGVNPGLPHSVSSATGTFAFGQPTSATAQSPASPFGPQPAPAPAAGPTLFTMGAAPAPAPRAMKKLPTRRGGKR